MPPTPFPKSSRDRAAERDRCGAEIDRFRPVIDRTRCEGKARCSEVCPYGVFEVRRIDPADFRALPLVARLKSIAHGRLTAYTPEAELCRACGLCLEACPERAIRLEPVQDAG